MAQEAVGLAASVYSGLSQFWRAGTIVSEDIFSPLEALNKALQQSNIYEQLDEIEASNPNAASALANKLSRLERIQEMADKIEILPDGSIQYYDKFRSAKTSGATIGSSFVTEYNPTTGNLNMWNETYDSLNNVNRIHLKNINGIQVDSPHYPPTQSDILDDQYIGRPNF
jgi:hypothetical protein